MAVAVRVYDGDEKVTEFVNVPSILAFMEGEEVVDYALVAGIDDLPLTETLDPAESAVLAWREAAGISYDRDATVREHILALAEARGDITALAILGVGGRRSA